MRIDVRTLINAIDETTLARKIGKYHDQARMRYQLRSNTVRSIQEFIRIITHYYIYHYGNSILRGGRLPGYLAAGRAKEILEREYGRRGGTLITAYNNALHGTESGLRAILDILAEGIKAEAIQSYIRNVFEQMVAPNSFEDKKTIIRQFIKYYGFQFSNALDPNQVERYALDYQSLIQAYSQGLRETSSIFRRL